MKLSFVACVAALSLAACSAADDPSTGEPSAETSEDLSAKSCKGLLPALCEVCADGTTACAHWVVKNHKCAIETCKQQACVQTVLCINGDHFDSTQCKCVPDKCVDNVLCIATAHWDQTQCACVPN